MRGAPTVAHIGQSVSVTALGLALKLVHVTQSSPYGH